MELFFIFASFLIYYKLKSETFMKKLKQFSLLLLSLAVLGSITSCNKDDDQGGLRDTHLVFGVTGDYAQSEDIIFQETNATSTADYTAMYSTSSGDLSVAIYAINVSWAFGIGADMSSLSTGSYTIPASGSYANTTTGATGFVCTGGTLTISSAESTSPYGNAGDRYISGSFSMTYENGANPVQQITIQGTFSNIYVVAGT